MAVIEMMLLSLLFRWGGDWVRNRRPSQTEKKPFSMKLGGTGEGVRKFNVRCQYITLSNLVKSNFCPWPGNPEQLQWIQRNQYFICTLLRPKPGHPGMGLKEQNGTSNFVR